VFVLLLIYLLELFMLVLFARAILSWIPLAYDSPWQRVSRVLASITEPVLRPVRRLLPPARIGNAALDLSFLVVFLGIQFVLIPVLYRFA
jgi:YggT family protein